MSDNSTVKLELRDDIAVITLDRPKALNALSFAIVDEISQRVGEVQEKVAGGSVRALLITGAGDKAFCAGADITELGGRGQDAERAAARRGQLVFAMLGELDVPSIACINGYAFGGGLELAMACTFRIALPTAKMGLPEIKLGLIPGYGGTQRLPRLVGASRAAEIIMSGRNVSAQEALDIGLVNRVTDDDEDVVTAGIEFAKTFTGYSLVTLGLAREAVSRALDVSLDEGLKIEADLSTRAFQSEDATEGMQAFVDKRKPEFRDR